MVKLGISVGDINGIGCEVALKTFKDQRMLDFCSPVFFASEAVLQEQLKALQLNMSLKKASDLKKLDKAGYYFRPLQQKDPKLEFGQSTAEAGAYAVNSFIAAVTALKKGEIDLLVTAPINKNNIQSADFQFPGHTDYLTQELEGQGLMFMLSEEVKVGLLTDHIAVKDVGEAINGQVIDRKMSALLHSLRADFGIRKPKIALLGINPHSGDNGTIGQEDEKIMKPGIKRWFDKGELVFGPYSADSFFGSGAHKSFDAVLAAYHDQGLIPFKTLSFGQGVNYTAGLQKVRTSPDHGTAYEIAGQNKADHHSFKQAVFTGLEILEKRSEFAELSSNPLQKQKMQRKKEKKPSDKRQD